MKSEEIIKRVYENTLKPFVTATFGDGWKEHAMEHFSVITLVDLAWKQGRRAILLEREIEKLCNEIPTKKTFSFDYISETFIIDGYERMGIQSTESIEAWDEEHATLLFKEMHPGTPFDAPY